jgi:hypothetical protein
MHAFRRLNAKFGLSGIYGGSGCGLRSAGSKIKPTMTRGLRNTSGVTEVAACSSSARLIELVTTSVRSPKSIPLADALGWFDIDVSFCCRLCDLSHSLRRHIWFGYDLRASMACGAPLLPKPTARGPNGTGLKPIGHLGKIRHNALCELAFFPIKVGALSFGARRPKAEDLGWANGCWNEIDERGHRERTR